MTVGCRLCRRRCALYLCVLFCSVFGVFGLAVLAVFVLPPGRTWVNAPGEDLGLCPRGGLGFFAPGEDLG